MRSRSRLYRYGGGLALLLALLLTLVPASVMAAKGGGGGGGKSTSLTLAAPLSGTEGETVTVTATLSSGGKPVGGQTVTLTANDLWVGNGTTDRDGNALFTYTLGPAGTYTLVGEFAGGKGYLPSQGTAVIEVSPQDIPVDPMPLYTIMVTTAPARYGELTTIEAQLDPAAEAVPVEFRLSDGTLLGMADTDGAGMARLTEYVLVPAGLYEVTATATVSACSSDGTCREGGSGRADLSVSPGSLTMTYTGQTQMTGDDQPLNLQVQLNLTSPNQGDITMAGPILFDVYTATGLLVDSFSASVDSNGVAAVTTWPLGNEPYTVQIYQAPPDNRYYQVTSIEQAIAAW